MLSDARDMLPEPCHGIDLEIELQSRRAVFHTGATVEVLLRDETLSVCSIGSRFPNLASTADPGVYTFQADHMVRRSYA